MHAVRKVKFQERLAALQKSRHPGTARCGSRVSVKVRRAPRSDPQVLGDNGRRSRPGAPTFPESHPPYTVLGKVAGRVKPVSKEVPYICYCSHLMAK